MKNFTYTLSDQSYIMSTARLECAIALGISSNDIYTSRQKTKSGKIIDGVWYLVGKEKDENGKPKKIYYKKDFRVK
jgi:hypothetical protein